MESSVRPATAPNANAPNGAVGRSPILSQAKRPRGRPPGGKLASNAFRPSERDEDVEQMSELRGKYDNLQQENDSLVRDIEKRQASYMRRENQYKQQIEHLKALLDKAVLGRAESDEGGMYRLRSLHTQIMDGISHLQSKTVDVLQEQEKDLLRAFRARLFEVQSELKKEREKKEDGALEWVEKTRSINKELEWTKDEALRLHRTNQAFKEENARLKAQFKAQDDDREFLVRELMAVKKDNARLRLELEKRSPLRHSISSRAELQPVEDRVSPSPTPTPPLVLNLKQQNVALAGQLSKDAENRYREVIARLQKLLVTERKNLRQARTSYITEIQSRTTLEALFRKCVADVQDEVRKRTSLVISDRPSSSLTTPRTALLTPQTAREIDGQTIRSFTKTEREKAMELFLSNTQVLEALPDMVFPRRAEPIADVLPMADDDTGLRKSIEELRMSNNPKSALEQLLKTFCNENDM
mmetsp:Transcript_42373/g.68721  ORF Transcript_42373/g.68721 Transcript_42373/m.68721 type:complete len:471 (+) Transcript_42373:41-1453(+)